MSLYCKAKRTVPSSALASQRTTIEHIAAAQVADHFRDVCRHNAEPSSFMRCRDHVPKKPRCRHSCDVVKVMSCLAGHDF